MKWTGVSVSRLKKSNSMKISKNCHLSRGPYGLLCSFQINPFVGSEFVVTYIHKKSDMMLEVAVQQ